MCGFSFGPQDNWLITQFINNQGGVTPVASVLPSATAVKIKVNGQLEIFFIVNSQATISL